MRAPALLLTLLAAAASAADYAIAASAATASDPGWSKVVARLRERHPGAAVVTWKSSPLELREALGRSRPRHLAIVAPPAEAGRRFVAACHRLSRGIDADPWPDVRWGIVTGRDAAAALRQLEGPREVVPRVALATTGIDLSLHERGLVFSDGTKGRWHEKRGPGDESGHPAAPRPPAAMWADFFRAEKPGLLVTSSHGFQNGFEMPFGTGFVKVRDGTLVPLEGQEGKPVGEPLADDPTPRVYLPIGNCLVGHVDGPDCLVTAMMGRLGVRQMAGYTVVTWFGRGGWDLLGTWQGLPGRHNLSEAFLINQARMEQDLLRLAPSAATFDLRLPDTGNPMPEPAFRRILSSPLAAEALAGLDPRSKEAQERARQLVGLIWDRETVAFYGDPAFDARLAKREEAGWTATLTEDASGATVVVRFADAAAAAKGAPDLAFFPKRRLDNPRLAEGPPDTLAADDLILLRSPRPPEGRLEVRARVTGG